MLTLKPPRLRKGDLIALVSPASTPTPAEKIEKSVRYLEALGYRVIVGEHASAQHGYLAGRDEQRAADFNRMLAHKDVRALFALRGGYGTPRILSLIDYKTLRRNPRIIAGFSDITALQLALYRRCHLVTFSGPMPAVEFWKDPDPYTEESFWRLLTSTKPPGPLKNPADSPSRVLKNGKAEGILLGGNLSLVMTSIGTPYFPGMKGAILVLEDVGEAPYRLDRMLTQLRHCKVASHLGGVVFGHFTDCSPKDTKYPHFTADQVLADFATHIDGPVLGDLQYGHIPRKLTVPFGLRAHLDTSRRELKVLESAVC